MLNNSKIYAMIPARIGSKRLKKKNIRLVAGKPMIYYAIQACRKSKFIDKIYVSTESDEIIDIAKNYGVAVLRRPKELSEDDVTTQNVMKHFAERVPDFDILVIVQANSPNVKTETINEAVMLMKNHNLWEVRCVNDDGVENGAVWVVRKKTIFWDGLSVYFGVVKDNSVDIHTEEDMKEAEKRVLDGE